MAEIKLFVPGIARTSGSHDSYQGRIVHAGKHTKDWMNKISWMFMEKYGRPCISEAPFYLNVLVYLPHRKEEWGKGRNAGKLKPSAPTKHTRQPDLDKLVRAIQDSLTNLVWGDDSQVIKLTAEKHFADKDHPPGILIYLKEVE